MTRCPKHPDIWLYEDMMETQGFCTKCHKWYDLKPLILAEITSKRAFFDESRKYRYILTRTVFPYRPAILFIMLNPSIADEQQDDPTIRRVMDFTERWGYGVAIIMNLFAFRSTDPKALKQVDNPVGDKNNAMLDLVEKCVDKIIAAWGVHGNYLNRDQEVLHRIHPKENVLFCLDKTKDGHPRHPLYVKRHIVPQAFGWENTEKMSVIRDQKTLLNYLTDS